LVAVFIEGNTLNGGTVSASFTYNNDFQTGVGTLPAQLSSGAAAGSDNKVALIHALSNAAITLSVTVGAATVSFNVYAVVISL
jgi:hypothetical protein